MMFRKFVRRVVAFLMYMFSILPGAAPYSANRELEKTKNEFSRSSALVQNPYVKFINSISLDTCSVIESIRGYYFTFRHEYAPMVYFDKGTLSLCIEYRFKELATNDLLGYAVVFPFLFNNKGKLAVRYVPGCESHVILLKTNLDMIGPKDLRSSHKSASKMCWFGIKNIIDISSDYTIGDDGTVLRDERVHVTEDRNLIISGLFDSINVVNDMIPDHIHSNATLHDECGIAPMIYTEMYDSIFDVMELLTLEARNDNGIATALKILKGEQS